MVLEKRRITAITYPLFEFQLQRSFATKVSCPARATFMLLDSSFDISCDAGVQTAVGAANNVKTVIPFAHAALSGITTSERVTENAKRASFHARTIFGSVGKGQHDFRYPAQLFGRLMQTQR